MQKRDDFFKEKKFNGYLENEEGLWISVERTGSEEWSGRWALRSSAVPMRALNSPWLPAPTTGLTEMAGQGTTFSSLTLALKTPANFFFN